MSSNAMISFRPDNVIRRLPWQFDGKSALGLLLLLVAFSLVAWLYLSQASAVATTSYRIDELRQEIDQLKNQNTVLSLEIAQFEALSRVESRARELGFRPAGDVQYLPVANYPLESAANNSANISDFMAVNPADSYSRGTSAGPWWLDTLDKFAAWLEGRPSKS